MTGYVQLGYWYIEEMEAFLTQITITPIIVQMKFVHIIKKSEVLIICIKKSIVMEGWYPLSGRCPYQRNCLMITRIVAIAEAPHHATAQVILDGIYKKELLYSGI